MKRFAKTCLRAVIVVIGLSGPALEGAIAHGDINNDGSVDITDVLNLFMWLSSEEVTDICQNAADVNRDGKVDLSDAIYLLIHMYGTNDGVEVPLPEHLVASCRDGMSSLGLRDVRSVVLTPRSAMITWLTAQPSSSTVRYGPSGALESRVDVDEGAVYHQVLLEGLSPGMTYYFQVMSSASGHGPEDSFIESFRTLEIEDFEIRPDHPRIFFTRDDIPDLRRKIKDSKYAEYWRMSERYCSTYEDIPLADLVAQDNFDDRIKAFAFVGLIGDVPGFRRKAIDAAVHLADHGTEGDRVREVTESVAFVYDWLHEHLESGVREKLLRTLIAQCRDLQGRVHDDEYVTGASHGHNKSLALAALAFHGDHSSAEDIVQKTVRDYRHGFLATWRRFSGGDGGSSKGWWYSAYVLPFELEFLAAWRSATGQDWYPDERVWCEPLLDWFTYGMRGDMTFLREGDGRVLKGLTGDHRLFASMVAKEYANPVAQWLGERARDADVVWGPYGIRELLWHDASIEAVPPSGPTSKIFRSAGVAIFRESWEPGGALASFRSAEVYTQGHTHRDSCTFTIFYKTGLAIDSGIYDDFSSSHHDSYYSRTVAHNGITVFDPGEKFVKYGVEHSNDGGQRWLLPGEGVAHYWPAIAEDTVDRSKGFRLGGITRWEDADRYTYVVGDGAPSYGEKVVGLERHFLWLRSVEGWGHPVAIVFDDVVSRRASFRKAYLLHTETRPAIEGSRVSVVNGEGALFQYTLAPEAPEITAIGGPGKEFWVDGANYPPERGTRQNEEPGAWRVEVSPSADRTGDRFLHALFVADAGDAPPAPPEGFTAGSLQGARVGEWVILFDTGDLPVTEVEYDSPRSMSTHLIFGAIPLARYDILADGVYGGSMDASLSGTLRFLMPSPVRVSVRLSPAG